MQNRYAGDVGDFGKLGMLRCIEKSGIIIGVNWYLVEDESHNQDGKHIGYLKNKEFLDLDEELRTSLASIITNNQRTINQLEQLNLLHSNTYYHEVLNSVKDDRLSWHNAGLTAMKDCQLVFLDPDNCLIPKSVGRGSKKSIKYVLPEELLDYYKAGHSVAFYSHRTREQLETYLHRFDDLFNSPITKDATIKGISFCRGTIRDYFFILHEEHKDKIAVAIDNILLSNWNRHFKSIDIPN